MKYFAYGVYGEFTIFDKWKGKFAVTSLLYMDQFKKTIFNL